MPSHARDDSLPAVPLNTKQVSVVLLAVAAVTGCGSDPRLRVDGSVLERITIENKLLLFDAENELDIALDDRDRAEEALARVHSDRKSAERRRERAERDVGVFEDKGALDRAEVARLRVAEVDARLRHLEAKKREAELRLEQTDRDLVTARARFELAKARLVHRNNVPGADDIDVDAFAAQVEAYEAESADMNPRIEQAEAEVAEAEEGWSDASAALRSASGGALGSRWLD